MTNKYNMSELDNYTDDQLRAELVKREHQRKGTGKVRCMDCKNLCSEKKYKMYYKPKRYCSISYRSGNRNEHINVGVWRKCDFFTPVENNHIQ